MFEIGPTGAGGMTVVPLSQLELLAWQINMGIRLQPWEVRALRRLSAQWCAMSHEAEDPDVASPWGEYAAAQAKSVTAGLRDVFRRMASL